MSKLAKILVTVGVLFVYFLLSAMLVGVIFFGAFVPETSLECSKTTHNDNSDGVTTLSPTTTHAPKQKLTEVSCHDASYNIS